jgi:hypothetical protein
MSIWVLGLLVGCLGEQEVLHQEEYSESLNNEYEPNENPTETPSKVLLSGSLDSNQFPQPSIYRSSNYYKNLDSSTLVVDLLTPAREPYSIAVGDTLSLSFNIGAILYKISANIYDSINFDALLSIWQYEIDKIEPGLRVGETNSFLTLENFSESPIYNIAFTSSDSALDLSSWTQSSKTLDLGESLIITKFWSHASKNTPLSDLFIGTNAIIKNTPDEVSVQARLYFQDSSTLLESKMVLTPSTPLDSFLLKASQALPYILDTNNIDFNSLHSYTHKDGNFVHNFTSPNGEMFYWDSIHFEIIYSNDLKKDTSGISLVQIQQFKPQSQILFAPLKYNESLQLNMTLSLLNSGVKWNFWTEGSTELLEPYTSFLGGKTEDITLDYLKSYPTDFKYLQWKVDSFKDSLEYEIKINIEDTTNLKLEFI